MKEQAGSKEARKTKNTFFLHFFPPTLSLSLFKRRRVLSRDRESERERGERCCCALGAERAAARALPSSLSKMAPPPPLATIGDFSARLAGLTLNSRPLIDALTVSAAEMAATPLGAALVADAVVERAATVRLPRGGGVERRRRREKASNHCTGKAASFFFPAPTSRFFSPVSSHLFFRPTDVPSPHLPQTDQKTVLPAAPPLRPLPPRLPRQERRRAVRLALCTRGEAAARAGPGVGGAPAVAPGAAPARRDVGRVRPGRGAGRGEGLDRGAGRAGERNRSRGDRGRCCRCRSSLLAAGHGRAAAAAVSADANAAAADASSSSSSSSSSLWLPAAAL